MNHDPSQLAVQKYIHSGVYNFSVIIGCVLVMIEIFDLIFPMRKCSNV